MKITILTLGSRGDVQPYAALGVGLLQAGHQVRIATSPIFESWLRSYGLDFVPIHANPQELMSSETGQKMLESGNAVNLILWMKKTFGPAFETILIDAWAASQGTEALIGSIMVPGCEGIAEALDIPFYLASVIPISATSAFPTVLMPEIPWLGGLYNRSSYLLMRQVQWQASRSMVNQWRRSTLGLPGIAPWQDPWGRIEHQKYPILYGYSSAVIPRPRDWAETAHVTGYWFLDKPPDFSPPAELVDFLAADKPPIYIGFGSMTNRDPAQVAEIVLGALKKSGQRGILLTGWGGIAQTDLPDSVFKLESIPHDWLFPQMAAVVHHGGAGTTAAGLRAGVPSIVVPFFADQPFWGKQLAHLGVGTKPIPRKELSMTTLAAAIQTTVDDKTMQKRAATLGETIYAEDGVKQAVQIITSGSKRLREKPIFI